MKSKILFFILFLLCISFVSADNYFNVADETALLRNGAYTWDNYGGSNAISTGNDGYDRTSIMKFNFSHITGNVTQARLCLFAGSTTGAITTLVSQYSGTDSWTEGGTNWGSINANCGNCMVNYANYYTGGNYLGTIGSTVGAWNCLNMNLANLNLTASQTLVIHGNTGTAGKSTYYAGTSTTNSTRIPNINFTCSDTCVGVADTEPNVTLNTPLNNTIFSYDTTSVTLNASYFDFDLNNGTLFFYANTTNANALVNTTGLLENGTIVTYPFTTTENTSYKWKACVNNSQNPTLVCSGIYDFSINADTRVMNTPSEVRDVGGDLTGGNLTSLQYDDLDYYNLSESGTPAFNITFNITKFNTTEQIRVLYNYMGSVGHTINLNAWNGTDWNLIGTTPDSIGFVNVSYSLGSEYNVSGVIHGQIIHTSPANPTHDYDIDLIILEPTPTMSNVTNVNLTFPSCTVNGALEVIQSFDCTGNINCTGVYNLSFIPSSCSVISGSLDGTYNIINSTSFNNSFTISCSVATDYDYNFSVTNTNGYGNSFNGTATCSASGGGGISADAESCITTGYLTNGSACPNQKLINEYNMIGIIFLVLALLVIGLWQQIPILIVGSGIGFIIVGNLIMNSNNWLLSAICFIIGVALMFYAFMQPMKQE